MTTEQLQQHSLWWTGPPWITQPQNAWPTQTSVDADELGAPEARAVVSLHTSNANAKEYSWELIYKYSSFHRLLRITALCLKFVDKLFKRQDASPTHFISAADMEKARIYWIQATQSAFFKDELAALAKGTTLPTTHPFTRLTAYLDHQGIARVGGRLQHSELSHDGKHPVILPRDSRLSALLIDHAHRQTMHGAVHLEVVTDYSADAFIAAFRRFAARRGTAASLYSDCGTNFQGADAQLQKQFKDSTRENQDLAALLAKDGTQWHFNPPAAPHMGGKWEAVVKSLKFHLKRTIGDALLTFEESITLLAQIEAILNSRPLEPLSDDPDDLSALTPGHFLIGSPLNAVPEPTLLDVSVNRLSRWQFLQQRPQQFWRLWSTHQSSQIQWLLTVGRIDSAEANRHGRRRLGVSPKEGPGSQRATQTTAANPGNMGPPPDASGRLRPRTPGRVSRQTER
ncbi:uncharacterized protein LOC123989163 [Osmia bicornis bicornis]|uniref:uncharacterized protein LOC123989163 n=1 Tax=Osmia bicornis bicornis TaxID=1437191 RepID=UPI001EAEA4A6|nr:uncharacterized protein LOC123989163 [Osmia bicornis bicornis]